jgi:hypothetical protein
MAGIPQSRGLVSGNQLRNPRVELLGAQMSALADAIRTIQTLTGQPVTVIGGLAVICRLSSPHRATSDLDIVNRRSRKTPARIAGGQVPPRTHFVSYAGNKSALSGASP